MAENLDVGNTFQTGLIWAWGTATITASLLNPSNTFEKLPAAISTHRNIFLTMQPRF
jgi:hypothetical protein